ncbi:MAG: murein biosynthesis integral membrane protein MurJ [Chloroflexi bacterium]|nr:murein biosynthesis integral membrane protein MurJ [Chloroflexota bacterium]
MSTGARAIVARALGGLQRLNTRRQRSPRIRAESATGPRRGIPISLRDVLRAALIVMSGFVVSKLLGLVRNIVISHQYGASREYESFLAAISLPDTVFQILAGGAAASAFIPVFTTYLSQHDEYRAWRLTSALINLAALVVGTIGLIIALAAPLLVGVLVPGWSAAEQEHVAFLTRMMMVAPIIFAISALATSVLNSVKRFALAAAAPLMYNLSLIVGALVLRPLGAEGLAIAAVAGALLHLAVQIPGLLRVGLRYTPTLGLDLAGTREVGRLMVPRTIGLGVSQLNLLVNVALASFLVQGSIAYLNYAWLILMVPLGVFGMGFSTAVFPTLAEQSAMARAEEERQTFQFSLRLILVLTIPAAVGLIVLGRPVVGLLLEHGAFDPRATGATAYALGFYAIGLPGHAMIEIIDRVFYADRDTATPVRAAAGAAAMNIILSVLLMRTQLSFGGLALANSLAALTEATVLALILERRMGWIRPREFLGFGWRVGLAALGAGLLAMLLQSAIALRVDPTHWVGQGVLVGTVATAGALTYLLLSTALGIDDVRRAANLLLRR